MPSCRPTPLLTLLLAVIGVLLATAPAALAAQKFIHTSAFGPDGTEGSTFSAANVAAFDQASNRLYVVDSSDGKIYGFAVASGTHTPLGAPFPLSISPPGALPGLAVDNSSAPSSSRLYYASQQTQTVSAFDSSGNPLGSPFPISPPSSPKAPCGVAVDSQGNFAVANSGLGNSKVFLYAPDGSPLGSVDTSTQGLPCGIAFDSHDNLFAAVATQFTVGKGLWKYTKSSGYAPGSATLIAPTTAFDKVSIDQSTEDIYLTVAGPQRGVQQFSADGTLIRRFATTEEIPGLVFVRDVVIDEATHDVYVSEVGNNKIHAYGFVTVPTTVTGSADNLTIAKATLRGTVNPSGPQVTNCHFEYTTDADFQNNGFANAAAVACSNNPGAGSANVPVSATLGGLDPGTDYRFRLVASNANGETLPGAASAFTTLGAQIKGESFSDVNETTATLHALINPNGQGTVYRFEYVTDAQFEQGGYANAATAPAGGAPIGNGSSYVAISQGLTGLLPGTTYHFRVVATNVATTTVGADFLFGTYAVDAVEGNCPNASSRGGLSALLPACRAYEQVSPTDKSGSDISKAPVLATSEGDAVVYTSVGAFAGSPSSAYPSPYLGMRGVDWLTKPLGSPLAPDATLLAGYSFGISGDLTKQLVATNLALAPGGVDGQFNLYLHDSVDDSYEFVATTSKSLAGFAEAVKFVGASENGSHFVFSASGGGASHGASLASIPPPPPASPINLYDFTEGNLKLVGILPNETVNPGGADINAANVKKAPAFGSVSADGRRIYWARESSSFLREDGQHTYPVGGVLWGASSDGSIAYTISAQKLTPDASPTGADLYRYDAEAHQLTDLTPDSSDPEGASVQGVLGVSKDGDYVYFAAGGALAPGAPSVSCKTNASNEGTEPCSLFAWHNGNIRYLGTMATRSLGVLGGAFSGSPPKFFVGLQSTKWGTYRVSSNGRYLAFGFDGQLTGPNPQSERDFKEAYLYDYAADSLDCASCPPTGIEGRGEVRFDEHSRFSALSHVPPYDANERGLTRNVSNSGQLFFESPNRLVPRDTNGENGCPPLDEGINIGPEGEKYFNPPTCLDVYEYKGGGVHLLSAGTSPDPSFFGDASASGDDAFILTRQAGLVGQDTDALVDVFDARIGGGISAQNPSARTSCQGEACRDAGTAAPPGTGAGSAAFQGAGNPAPPKSCPKGTHRVRRKGKMRCVKRHLRTADHDRRTNR
jgi:hypothetical protein